MTPRLANIRQPFYVPGDFGPMTDEMKRVNKLFEDVGLEPHKINKCLKAGNYSVISFHSDILLAPRA